MEEFELISLRAQTQSVYLIREERARLIFERKRGQFNSLLVELPSNFSLDRLALELICQWFSQPTTGSYLADLENFKLSSVLLGEYLFCVTNYSYSYHPEATVNGLGPSFIFGPLRKLSSLSEQRKIVGGWHQNLMVI